MSENIPPAIEAMTQNPLYIYWKCQVIYSTSYCCSSITGSLDMGIFNLKKKNIIWEQNLYFNLRAKSLFLSFQKSFSASFFRISQEQPDQNSSLTP